MKVTLPLFKIGQFSGTPYEYTTELADKLMSEINLLAAQGHFLGEVGYPSPVERVDTCLNDASHMVNCLSLVAGELVGEITILDTPKGGVLKQLIESRVPIKLGIRATGCSDSDGKAILNHMFKIRGLDVIPISDTLPV